MAHEKTCKKCGEVISGPAKKSVTATMKRHAKKHSARAKRL